MSDTNLCYVLIINVLENSFTLTREQFYLLKSHNIFNLEQLSILNDIFKYNG